MRWAPWKRDEKDDKKVRENPPRPAEPLSMEDWRARPCYVIVSPYKTATTAVGEAIVELGAGHRIMPYDGSLLKNRKVVFRKWENRLDKHEDAAAFVEARATRVREKFSGFAQKLTRFDVFADAPFGHGHVHPTIVKCIAPLARMIWIERPVDDWLASVRHWEETHPETYPNHTLWQTDPEKRTARAMRLRDERYRNFRFTAESFPDDCLELFIDELQDHARLAAFCGVEDPGRPLRKANVSSRD